MVHILCNGSGSRCLPCMIVFFTFTTEVHGSLLHVQTLTNAKKGALLLTPICLRINFTSDVFQPNRSSKRKGRRQSSAVLFELAPGEALCNHTLKPV
ncbi:hypothetical protein ACFX15_009797 [Malus domestica]